MSINKQNIQIRRATESDSDALAAFNELAFPTRTGHKEFIEFRRDYGSIFYLVLDGEKIIGSRVMFKQKMSYNQKVYDIVWSTDTFIDEEYRGLGLGKDLFKKMVSESSNCFTINTGERATGIYLKNGFREVGLFNYYFKPLNWLNFFNSSSKMIRKVEFNKVKMDSTELPQQVDSFEKIEDIEEFMLRIPTPNYQDKLQTFKDKTYFEWRYFYKKNVYSVYVNSDNYFIFRTIFWKGMKCFILVDFTGDLNLVYKALKKMANRNRISGILWASSDVAIKKNLKKNGFINYHKTPIISNIELENPNLKIAFQFSDSDLDYNYSNTPFVYI